MKFLYINIAVMSLTGIIISKNLLPFKTNAKFQAVKGHFQKSERQNLAH